MQPALSTPAPAPAFAPIPLPPDSLDRDPEWALPPVAVRGCGVCGDPADGHGRQWHPQAGFHGWEEPTAGQVEVREAARIGRRISAARFAREVA
ncbi:hypothetical protein F0L17_14645 [Streptomyces sp. TRM43335]|uniref:Uncharacterized protein n=1 Tax=Streptomyces taklimakanensis TaxID=2569853 RepID=A0A6G2BDN3_9ACTN|nr:hypothetical protein [Streptomyces taklimakanensis]MTE20324.1 hypothetical protein [Streptomyces taklimakanensis]